MEKLEDFIKRMAKVINESDKNQIFYEQGNDFEDDLENDDLPTDLPLDDFDDQEEEDNSDDSKPSQDDDKPSYRDVILASITEKEYKNLSDDKKEEIYQMAEEKRVKRGDKGREKPSYYDVLTFQPTREEYAELSDEEKQEFHDVAKKFVAMKSDKRDDYKYDSDSLRAKDEVERASKLDRELKKKKKEEKFKKKWGYTGDDFVDVKRREDGMVTRKDKDDSSGGENAFLFMCEMVEVWGPKEENGISAQAYDYKKQEYYDVPEPDYQQRILSTDISTITTIQGKNVESLVDFVTERLEYFKKEYKIDLNDGHEIGPDTEPNSQEGEDNYDDELEKLSDLGDEDGKSEKTNGGKKGKFTDGKKPMLSAPKEIRKIDSAAFGYMYVNTWGNEKVLPREYVLHKKYGGSDQKDKSIKEARTPEKVWDTIFKTITLEYIIYTSDAVIKNDSFSDVLTKKFGNK